MLSCQFIMTLDGWIGDYVSLNDSRSSIRFLVSGSGSRSSVFLGLASSGVGDEQGTIVLKQEFYIDRGVHLISRFSVSLTYFW
jgi:hypothetical protein